MYNAFSNIVNFRSKTNSAILGIITTGKINKQDYVQSLFSEFQKLIGNKGDLKILQIKKCIKLVQNAVNNYGIYPLDKNDDYFINRNQYDEILNRQISGTESYTIKDYLEIICVHRNYLFKDKKYSFYKTNYTKSAWKLKSLISAFYTDDRYFSKDNSINDTSSTYKRKSSLNSRSEIQVIDQKLKQFTNGNIISVLQFSSLTCDQLSKIYCINEHLDMAFTNHPNETKLCFESNFEKINYYGRYQFYRKLRNEKGGDNRRILKKIFMSFFSFNIVGHDEFSTKHLEININNIEELLCDFDSLNNQLLQDEVSKRIFSNFIAEMINNFIVKLINQSIDHNKSINSFMKEYIDSHYKDNHALCFYISFLNDKDLHSLKTRRQDIHIISSVRLNERVLARVSSILQFMIAHGYINDIQEDLLNSKGRA